MSAVSGFSDVGLAESRSAVPKRASECISNAEKEVPMKVVAADEVLKLNNMQPLEVEIALSRSNMTDDNAEKFVSVHYIWREKFESVKIDANLDQIVELPS